MCCQGEKQSQRKFCMSALLDQGDVHRLMAQPSPHVRAIIASKIGSIIDQPRLSDAELQLAQDIVRTLSKDVELVVRRAVAQNLRRSKRLPHDVALHLADDVEAVALPILADSLVLTDDDLVAVLQHSSAVKQKAIAGRPHLSEKVSDVIVTTANEDAVATLMNNESATINEHSMDHAVDRFAASDLVKESMVKRTALPVTIAERLAVIVSEKLQEHLIAHHELSPTVAAEILAQGRERAVIQLNQNSGLDEIERLVEQMHANKRLTPSFILRALCVGNLPFFEFAMAALADIPVTNARILIHEPGGAALKALCEKNGISKSFADTIRVALDVMEQLKLDGEEQDLKRFRIRLIERVLTQTDAMDQQDIDYLLELMK